MHPVAYIEFVSVTACLAAILFLIRGWKRSTFLPAVKILLLILLILMMFYEFSLFLEWSGFGERFRWHFIEDLASVFIPLIWSFAFYAFVKNAVEDDLRTSRAHYRSLVESTNDWIWEVDAAGQYTYSSPQVEHILGYRPDEIIGKTPFDLMPPEEVSSVSAIFTGFIEKQEPFQNLENTNLDKNGNKVILETNATPIFDRHGFLIGYHGIDRDITRRKQAEKATAQRQAELDSIFAASPAGIGLIHDRRLIRGNARLYEITGCSKDELFGKDARWLYLSEQEYLDVGAKYTEAMENGIARIETRWVRKDQTVIDIVLYMAPLDPKDNDTAFVVVMQDITALKVARQEAEIEKTRAQLYLDVAGVMIVVLDTDHRVKLINKKGCEILEYSAEQVIGVDWFSKFLPASYRAITRNAFDRIISGEEKSVEYFENPVLTRSGGERLIAWHNSVLRDSAGKIIGVISSGEDITDNRAAERARRESEERLQVALSAAKMGTWRYAPEHNQFTRSAGLNALLGLVPTESTQSIEDFYNYVHPDDRDAMRYEFERAVHTNEMYIARFRIVQPGNSRVCWVLNQGKPFYDFNGKLEYVTGVVVDITERQQAEIALRESEKRFRAVANYTYDWETWINSKGEIEWINPAVERMSGYTVQECQQMNDYPLPIVHEEDRELVVGIMKKALQGSSGNDRWFRIRKKGGSILWCAISWQPICDEQGQSLGYRSSIRNISERKQAEDEMRISRDTLKHEMELFENMFHTIPDSIYIKDLDSRFTHVNESGLQKVGLQNEQDVIGKTDFDFFTEEHARPAYEDEQEIMRTGIPKIGYEEKETHPDGHVTWCLSTKMPLRDVAGNIIGLIGISHDITDRKIAEQKIRDNDAALQKAQQIARLGFYVWDLKNDVISVSEGLKTFFGCKPEEAFTFDLVTSRIHPEDRDQFIKFDKECREKGIPFNMDYRILLPDGQTRWAHDQAETEVDEQGNIVRMFGIIQDITTRKQAEQTLQFTQFAIDHAGEGAFWMKSDATIFYVNEAACRSLGYTSEELLQMSVYDIDPDVGPEEWADIWEYTRTYGTHQIETRHKRKDGRIFPVEINGNFVVYDGNEYSIAFARDIADRKRAAEALAESEQRFRNIVESSPMGIHTYSLEADGRLVLTGANAASAKILGRDFTDKIGRTIEEVYPPLAKTEIPDAYRRLCRQGGIYQEENFEYHDDFVGGFYTLTAFQTSPGNMATLFIDVTNRIMAEQVLRFTQFAIDHTSEEVYWINEKGKFVYVNDAACEVLGYSRDELLKMMVSDIDPDFTVDVWPGHWKELKRKHTMRFESRHKTKDGRIFPVEITANYLIYEDVEYNCAFARDISERKAAEQTRDVLMQQLQERSNELQSIVFTAAHDLRSPLVNIDGFTTELEKSLRHLAELIHTQSLNKQTAERINYLFETDMAESLRFIKSGSHQMGMLLDGLMRLSRVGSAPLSVSILNMNELLDTVIEGLQYHINEYNVTIHVQLNLPHCMGDAILLGQVFTNLLDNAIKYRHPDRPVVIDVSGSVADNTAQYKISDNGIGIELEHLEKVFELFHRLGDRKDEGGQGVGLTIVRRILDRLNGNVKIDSTPNIGTAVHIRLPMT